MSNQNDEKRGGAVDTKTAKKVVNTATKAVEYARGAGFKYMHLGKITMEKRDLEQKRLEVLQKIGLKCVQCMQDGVALDQNLFKTLHESYTKINQDMDALNLEQDSVKKLDPTKIKSSKYNTGNSTDSNTGSNTDSNTDSNTAGR